MTGYVMLQILFKTNTVRCGVKIALLNNIYGWSNSAPPVFRFHGLEFFVKLFPLPNPSPAEHITWGHWGFVPTCFCQIVHYCPIHEITFTLITILATEGRRPFLAHGPRSLTTWIADCRISLLSCASSSPSLLSSMVSVVRSSTPR